MFLDFSIDFLSYQKSFFVNMIFYRNKENGE
ncbi:putative uncharacterized protein [Waddlia chondrophila 2032/99]|uniref:Uncharacterized protein n=2 Tax=Waddlia chondrophila TaxID=71667 RepID=D6YSP8_WADCW|nr:hypothetical protein wcw_1752 [Waddlia chondrophila WSU 86-1044]CCB92204.1 putative uncharacterized protein [Waddlia chondrophila 2032/99]